MGRPVLNVAWQGTPTVHGMALSARDTFPWLRGTDDTFTLVLMLSCHCALQAAQNVVHGN